MATITKEQLKGIIEKAPEGKSSVDIVKSLINRGHTIEGLETAKTTAEPNLLNQISTTETPTIPQATETNILQGMDNDAKTETGGLVDKIKEGVRTIGKTIGETVSAEEQTKVAESISGLADSTTQLIKRIKGMEEGERKEKLKQIVRENMKSMNYTREQQEAVEKQFSQLPEVLVEYPGNVVESTKELGTGITEAITKPEETITGLGKILAGGIQSIPGIDTLYNKYSTEKGKATLESNREAFNTLLNYYKDKYGGKNAEEIVRNVADTAYNDPVGFTLDLSVALQTTGSVLGTTSKVTKSTELAKASQTISKIGESIDPIKVVANTINGIFDSILGKKTTAKQTAAEITQAKTEKDIQASTKALQQIDTANTGGYKALGDKIDDGVKLNSKAVDKTLAQYDDLYKTKDLVQKSVGGTVKMNFVKQAISDLKDLYNAINNINAKEAILKLESKMKTIGLTLEEINNLAREYGIQNNAFKLNNQLKAGKIAAGYENVRSGLKNTVKTLIPDADVANSIGIIDSQTNALLRTRDLVEKVAQSIQNAANKVSKSNLLTKIAGTVADLINRATGNGVSRFLRSLQGFSGSTSFNYLELESQLQKTLNTFEKLNSMSADNIIKNLNNLTNILETGYYVGTVLDQMSKPGQETEANEVEKMFR